MTAFAKLYLIKRKTRIDGKPEILFTVTNEDLAKNICSNWNDKSALSFFYYVQIDLYESYKNVTFGLSPDMPAVKSDYG